MLFLPFKIAKYLVYLVGIAFALALLTGFLGPKDELLKSDVVIAISGGETGTRTHYAIDLYEENWAPKIIFSGDAYDPLSESNADVMQQIATLRQVPSEDILIDENADNTKENAVNIRSIIQESGYERVILVTSEYHQRRAYMEFSSALEGIEIINAPVSEDQWSRNWWWTSPMGWKFTFSEAVKIPITFVRNSF